MKKIAKVTFLSIVIILFGCKKDDFFERTNPPQSPWSTISEFEQAASGAYAPCFYEEWGGHFFVGNRVILDGMTDLVSAPLGYSATYPTEQIYNRLTNVTINRADYSFKAAYKAIARCNAALDYYYNSTNLFPFETLESKENNLKRIVGELHFIRAYAYYNLALINLPAPQTSDFNSLKIIPLRNSFSDAKGVLNPKFGSGRDIYEQIRTDLTTAKELLPLVFENGKHHPSYEYGRANKYAAAMLKMKLHFELGEETEALQEADFIINSGQYSLNQDPLEAFIHDDISKGEEVIWYALYSDSRRQKEVVPKDASIFTFLHYISLKSNPVICGWHIFPMSQSICKQIGWMDADLKETENAKFDKRYNQLYVRLEKYKDTAVAYSEKYELKNTTIKTPYLWNNKYYRGGIGRYTNIPVFRLAEVYLTRSYLQFKKGNLAAAADDLNIIRARAWDQTMAKVAYNASTNFLTSGTIKEEDIHNERVKELAFEGDWLRYLQVVKKEIGVGDRNSISPVPFPYTGLYWKMPLAESDFYTK